MVHVHRLDVYCCYYYYYSLTLLGPKESGSYKIVGFSTLKMIEKNPSWLRSLVNFETEQWEVLRHLLEITDYAPHVPHCHFPSPTYFHLVPSHLCPLSFLSFGFPLQNSTVGSDRGRGYERASFLPRPFLFPQVKEGMTLRKGNMWPPPVVAQKANSLPEPQ